MKWITKNGQILNISEMTDSHIRNAWKFVYRQLDFGITDEQFVIFEAFKAELQRRHQWNLKFEIQYRDMGTRNVIHQIAEGMMDYDMHGYDYM